MLFKLFNLIRIIKNLAHVGTDFIKPEGLVVLKTSENDDLHPFLTWVNTADSIRFVPMNLNFRGPASFVIFGYGDFLHSYPVFVTFDPSDGPLNHETC